MQTRKKHVGATISHSLWKSFVVLLARKEMKTSEFLRNSIKKFVEDNKEKK